MQPREHRGEELASLREECDRAWAIVDRQSAELAAARVRSATTAAREFSALVDEARANHVRWEHTAELLEECLRPLCIGAKVLLWPDPDAPRSSALAEPREADA